MPKWLVWPARILLVVVVVIAFIGAADANERLVMNIRADRVNHGALSYAITLLLLAAFPRVPIWIPPAFMLCVGAGLEGLQWLGFFAGDAQFGDMVADATGIALAAIPFALGRLQTSLVVAASTTSEQPAAGSQGEVVGR